MPKVTRKSLLLEYTVVAQSKWIVRVYDDGRVDEYSDQETSFENGEIIYMQVPARWQSIGKLSDRQLKRLIGAITQSGFFNLPPKLGSDNVKDGTTTKWVINLDDKRHEVTERISGDEHPSLKKLSDLINQLIADMFDSVAHK